jgi:hypothetical protein
MLLPEIVTGLELEYFTALAQTGNPNKNPVAHHGCSPVEAGVLNSDLLVHSLMLTVLERTNGASLPGRVRALTCKRDGQLLSHHEFQDGGNAANYKEQIFDHTETPFHSRLWRVAHGQVWSSALVQDGLDLQTTVCFSSDHKKISYFVGTVQNEEYDQDWRPFLMGEEVNLFRASVNLNDPERPMSIQNRFVWEHGSSRLPITMVKTETSSLERLASVRQSQSKSTFIFHPKNRQEPLLLLKYDPENGLVTKVTFSEGQRKHVLTFDWVH